MQLTQEQEAKVIDALARYAHDSSWTGWMEWLFKKGTWNKDGSFRIDQYWAARWKRQMETKYDDLSPTEKETDQVEAQIILVWIRKALED